MTAVPIFRVAADIFERFPNYFVACVAARGIDPSAATARFDESLGHAAVRARATYDGLDLKAQAPFAAWRDAFSSAGWSASRFPASVEAIHKRIQRGADLPRINAAVDLANSAVLYYAVPIGTHDMASFAGRSLEVRTATPSDAFLAMGGDSEPADTHEIVYAVGADIRTRRWVWRQGRNALISADATDVFYPIDGFTDRTYDAVVAAQNFLAEMCVTELGARVTTGVVTSESRDFFLRS